MKRLRLPLLAVAILCFYATMTTATGNENAPVVQNVDELNSANSPVWANALTDGTTANTAQTAAMATLEDADYVYTYKYGGNADVNLTTATFDYTATFVNDMTATTRAEGSGFSLYNEEREGVGDNSAAVMNDSRTSDETTKTVAIKKKVANEKAEIEVMANTSAVIRG